jgi:hypothetical protein
MRITPVALAATAMLAILISPARADTAPPSCPPSSATWSSADPYASEPVTSAGMRLTVVANQWPLGSRATVWAGPGGSWGVCEHDTADSYPYPEERLTLPGTPAAGLGGLVSTYADQLPDRGRWQGEAAYDIWLDAPQGSPGTTEVMIWTDWTPGEQTGNAPAGAITVAGQRYLLGVDAGLRRVSLMLPAPADSGTQDILALVRALAADPRTVAVVGASPRLYELDWGFEVHETGGATLAFTTTRYTLSVHGTALLRSAAHSGSGCCRGGCVATRAARLPRPCAVHG